MNIYQGIAEKAQEFEKQIKRIFSKYENKDLSSSERNDALTEVAIFNEQVEGFSLQLGSLQGKAKSQALVVLDSLKKLGAGIEKNIHDNTPSSEYM